MSQNAPPRVDPVRASGADGTTLDLGGEPPPQAPIDAAAGRLPYPVWVGRGLLDLAGEIAASVGAAHRIAVVTDHAVGALHAPRLMAQLPADALRLELPPGEQHKTRAQWARLTDELLAARCGRDTLVVALGGGVVGDLAGFVAATYMRGVPVMQVPTTLLAMVDASVGGKTGVDTPAGKNLVGAFHPPRAVVVDPLVLATLPAPELMAGFAEVIKHGVIADAAYLASATALLRALAGAPPRAGDAWRALEAIVAGSIAIKADVVARDEREGGVRKTLNFGHTVGHAVEALSGYTLRHGEAVAVGMVAECACAERMGLAPAGTSEVVRGAVRLAGLPDRLPEGMAPDAVVAATSGDKKARAGVVEYALPERIGAMTCAGGRWSVPVPNELVRDVLMGMA